MSSLLDIFGKGNGKKFYMRDFKNAYRARPDVNPVRQKFQGYVNFVLNRTLYGQLFGDPQNSNEFRTTISSFVRTASLPGVTFRTETKNQYNRKKIVNTGVEYSPVEISVYDTVGNEWLITLMKYFAYHYMNPRNKNNGGSSRDVYGYHDRIGGTENSVGDVSNPPKFGLDGIWNSNEAGYNINQDAYFFERIDYVLYHGNKGVQYSLINPVLASFEGDTIDYTSSEPLTFNLRLEYESFTTHNVANFGLSIEDLDRFENASGFTGDAFVEANLPLVMKANDGAGTDLSILGKTNTVPNMRNRSIQPILTEAVQEAQEPASSAITDDSPSAASVTTALEQGTLPETYGTAAVFNNGTGFGDSFGIGDLLSDVADNALAAVISGGNVKDAAIGTFATGVQTIVGQAQERGSNNLPGED